MFFKGEITKEGSKICSLLELFTFNKLLLLSSRKAFSIILSNKSDSWGRSTCTVCRPSRGREHSSVVECSPVIGHRFKVVSRSSSSSNSIWLYTPLEIISEIKISKIKIWGPLGMCAWSHGALLIPSYGLCLCSELDWFSTMAYCVLSSPHFPQSGFSRLFSQSLGVELPKYGLGAPQTISPTAFTPESAALWEAWLPGAYREGPTAHRPAAVSLRPGAPKFWK